MTDRICPYCDQPINGTTINGLHPKCHQQYNAEIEAQEKQRPPLTEGDWDLIQQARQQYGDENVQIDDDAKFAAAETGTWVSAWVFVEG